jgi:hypothetical protein
VSYTGLSGRLQNRPIVTLAHAARQVDGMDKKALKKRLKALGVHKPLGGTGSDEKVLRDRLREAEAAAGKAAQEAYAKRLEDGSVSLRSAKTDSKQKAWSTGSESAFAFNGP